MILNTYNAKRFYDEMGHDNFDKVVKMAELIVRNTFFDEYEMSLKYMDSKESMGYVKRFFESINPDYYLRVCNILGGYVKNDSFQSDLAQDYSDSKTFPLNDGLCFVIREVDDDEFGEFTGKNKFNPATGQIVINREDNIKTAFSSVHELAHRLASSGNPIDFVRYFYREIPSITFEELFLDWLEEIGHPHEEINYLKKQRNICFYMHAFLILIANELIKSSKDEVDLDEIIDSLNLRIPNIDARGLNMDVMKKMYGKDIDYFGYRKLLLCNIPYIIGRVMRDYYVMDYRKNGFNADIFKFMHLYGDGHLDENAIRYYYMLLNLPFENDNMEELEKYFDGDISDVEYYDVEDKKKQTQVYS